MSDDDQDKVFLVDTGPDGVWTPEDGTPSSFSTRPLNGDAEDLTMDMDATTNGHVLVIDGVNTDVYDYGPGLNGTFDALPPAGDDTRLVFDVGQYGALDPEGIEYYPGRNTILLLDSGSRAVYEIDRLGRLVNVVSIAAGGPRHAAGITLAPPSDGSPGLNLYVSDRGADNDSDPDENDGRFYEMAVTLPPLGDSTNRAPQVNAGPDLAVAQSVSATLSGSAGDDGLPDPPGHAVGGLVDGQWPGNGGVRQPERGVDESDLRCGRELRPAADRRRRGHVRPGRRVRRGGRAPPGGAVALDVPTGTGADDAEERSATTSVTGTDLELVVDGTTVQTVGIRFPGVAIPAGSTVTNAYVQFTVDELTTGDASLTVAGQAADNPPAFSSTGRDVSTRPRTTATVGWTPAGWPTVGRPRSGPAHPRPRSGAAGDRGPVRLGQRQRTRPRDHRQRDAHRLGDRAWPGEGPRPARRVRAGRWCQRGADGQRRAGSGDDPAGGGVAGRDRDR